MRLTDYRYASEAEKKQWLKNINFELGMKYFGGKSEIGRFIFNRICNMAVRMQQDGKNPDIFLDVFTGGGKMALGIPAGWFNKIVMNDIDYGVYSFYKCCKEEPNRLIEMIKYVGSMMSKMTYQFIAFNRANSPTSNNYDEAQKLAELYELIKDIDKNEKVKKTNSWLKQNNRNEVDEDTFGPLQKRAKLAYVNKEFVLTEAVDNITAAAFTFWVTKADFLGRTDPFVVAYSSDRKDDTEKAYLGIEEKEKIEQAIKSGEALVKRVHRQMVKNNIIVENLDYKELIKKYNGKPWKDLEGNSHEAIEEYKNANKLWYMDPPYHPAALYAGNMPGYEEAFDRNMVIELVHILHNDEEKTYGKLEYFLKSDYNPKYNLRGYEQIISDTELKIRETENKLKTTRKNEENKFLKERLEKLKRYKVRYEKQLKACEKAAHDFDILEENDKESSEYYKKKGKNEPEYYIDVLGEFNKGVKDDYTGEVLKGTEFLWCRGNYSVETAGVYNGGVLVEQKQEEQ